MINRSYLNVSFPKQYKRGLSLIADLLAVLILSLVIMSFFNHKHKTYEFKEGDHGQFSSKELLLLTT